MLTDIARIPLKVYVILLIGLPGRGLNAMFFPKSRSLAYPAPKFANAGSDSVICLDDKVKTKAPCDSHDLTQLLAI